MSKAERQKVMKDAGQYLQPGAMLKEDWERFVEQNGRPPTWAPAHRRQMTLADMVPGVRS